MIETRKFFENQKSIPDIYRWVKDLYEKGVTDNIEPYDLGKPEKAEEYIAAVEAGKATVLGASVQFFLKDDYFHEKRKGNKLVFYFTDFVRMPEMYAPFEYDNYYRHVSGTNPTYALGKDFRAQLEPFYDLTDTPEEIIVHKGKNDFWGRYVPAKFPMQRNGKKVYDIFKSKAEYCCAVGYYPYDERPQIIEGNCVMFNDDGQGNIHIEMGDRVSGKITGTLDIKEAYDVNWEAPKMKGHNDISIDPKDILVIWKETPDSWGASTPTDFLRVLDVNGDEVKLVFLEHTTHENDLGWSHYRGLHSTTIYPQLKKEQGQPFIAKYNPDNKKMPLEAPELKDYIGMQHWNWKDVQIAFEDSTD